jgi:hypothetical protein
MNPSLPAWVLSATAIILVVGNVAVRSSRPQVEPLDEITREAVEGQAVTDIAQPANSARQGMAATVSVVESTPPSPEKGADLAALEWAVVETTDYLQYAANLRRLDFPEDLVRAIIIADFNQLYEPREAALRPRPVPFDAPAGQGQRLLTLDDFERMRQLRDVQLEKQAALQEILGIYVPRDLLTTPTSRNYVAYEYALSLLPPEKREAAQLALEDEWLVDDANKHLDRASYVQAYKLTREERNSALTSILTAEEFEQFEMNSNPAGTELARRVIRMEPTDDEFHAMFRIAWDHWVETGGVGGLWRAERVLPEQIAAAEDRMHERLLETLGPDRWTIRWPQPRPGSNCGTSPRATTCHVECHGRTARLLTELLIDSRPVPLNQQRRH